VWYSKGAVQVNWRNGFGASDAGVGEVAGGLQWCLPRVHGGLKLGKVTAQVLAWRLEEEV